MFAAVYFSVQPQPEAMETVTVTREFDAPADIVQEVVRDADTFLRAVGFDVSRDGDVLTLARQVAIKRIELRVRLVDDDAVLAYEQVEGIFEEMRTRYVVTGTDGGCSVTVETAFEPPTSGFGTFINDMAVKHLRRSELAELETVVEERSETIEQTTNDTGIDAERE